MASSRGVHGRWLSPLLLVGIAGAQAAPAWLPLREGSLELVATWQPLTDTTYGFEKRDVVSRLAPAAVRASYGADAFRAFVPPAAVEVGDCWQIDAAAVLPFLRQLHPGAATTLHHDRGDGISAHGAWAVLRALDADRAEIVLRAHAEFRIDGDGAEASTSWLTPAMFRGRLSIDRRAGCVEAFELALPRSRANVDLNVATAEGVICDIGCIPALQVAGGTFAPPAADAAQITEREADRILERRFYPFAALDWLDLPAARAASLASGKPLHVVLLFGSLPDESC